MTKKLSTFFSTKKVISLSYFMALTLLLSCGEKAEEEKKVKVSTAKVVTETIRFTQNFPASVVALEEVDLRADVVGYITSIQVQEGQKVRKGQLLYTIDQTRIQARKQQAESAVAIAEGNVERLRKDFERYERLRSEDAIAGQIYDNARIDLRNAEQELSATKAELENTAIDLQYASIHAPFDGTVGFSQVRVGTLVNPGETLLNTISRDDPIGVDFFPEERFLGKFQALIDNENVVADSIFQIKMPGGDLYEHFGSIEIVDRAVDRNTGTIQIRLKFPNPQNKLRPGLSTTLSVKDNESESALLVPRRSVTEQMGEFSVYVVEDGQAKQRKIKTGRNIRDMTVVTEGLEPGDEVVVKGVQKLQDGDTVEIVEGGEVQ